MPTKIFKLDSTRRIVYKVIFILSFVRLPVAYFIYPNLSWIEYFNIWFFGIIFILMIFELVYSIHLFLNRKIPFEENLTQRLLIQILSSVLIILALEYMILNYIIPYIVSVDTTSYNVPWVYGQIVILIFGVNMTFFGQYFFKAWKQKIIETERLAKEKALVEKEYTQVKFANLQNQLNPHFLFNSITSLHSLIYENQDLAADFLGNLAKVYRYVLQHKNQDLLSIQTEIEFIQHYVFLLKVRFEDSFQINIELKEANKDLRIVPVTLQILIENAIKHNMMIEEKPLTIHLYAENQYFCVENNLQKKNIVETSNKIGLENLKSLYAHLSPEPLLISESQEKFIVKIPLIP